ncbi:MAG TPA: hypothetical protein VG994_05570, partial [Steroidobacteraceae bacterium]|nr:hypothetical protein [Steroidobacteraceae bacterium]
MLLGLFLIAAPLVVALVDAGLQIRVLASTGQKLVTEGVGAARASQEMFSKIAEVERAAKLYNVLKTSDVLTAYRNQDEGLSAIRSQLDRHLRTAESRKTLEELGDLQGTIRLSVLSMPHGAADPDD